MRLAQVSYPSFTVYELSRTFVKRCWPPTPADPALPRAPTKQKPAPHLSKARGRFTVSGGQGPGLSTSRRRREPLRERGSGQVGHQALGGQHHLSHRGRVLQSGAGDLGGVDECRQRSCRPQRLPSGRRSRSWACRPETILSMMTLPSRPAFSAIWRRGASRAFQDDAAAGALVTLQGVAQGLDCGDGVDGAVPPPATTPSSTAALVAFRASSMRSFLSSSPPRWQRRP